MTKWVVLTILSLSCVASSSVFAESRSIIQTITGVESDIKGSISDVNSRTVEVFKEQGIQQTGLNSENSGTKQTLKGKKGNIEVSVELTTVSPEQTHAVVTAKEGTLNWKKDFAQEILSKIVQSS